VKDAQRIKVIFVPVYNGTYFDSLFKLATRMETIEGIQFYFFFGKNYPGQDRHLLKLHGKFEYFLSESSEIRIFKTSRIIEFARRKLPIDGFFDFFELSAQYRRLNRELCYLWDIHEIPLCIFPADNRYRYPFISKFVRSRGSRLALIPQWFAGPREIEEALGHSNLYRPGKLVRFLIRRIDARYLRKISGSGFSYEMIPIRFSEIVLNCITGCTPPNPWVLHSGYSDRIFVESVTAYNFALSLGIDEAQLNITGSLYLDEMDCERLTKRDSIRLLVAIAPDMFSSRINTELEFLSYEEYLIYLCTKLRMLGYEDAVISMHPSDSGEYHRLIQSNGFEISEEPLHILLARSEIFLATISATIQWAIYLGLPTINFDFYNYQYPDYVESPLVIGVQNKQDLDEAFIQALHLSKMYPHQSAQQRIMCGQPNISSFERLLLEINSLIEMEK
jgi:hypothetical protein